MSYTIAELSVQLSINKKTPARWIDEGLRIVDGSKKPILLMGSDVKEFLKNRASKKKVKLGRNQFYCVGCKRPRHAKRGSLKKSGDQKKGACPVCGGKMCRIF